VVINKCDLNHEQTHAIEGFCRKHQLALLGKLPHDTAFTQAMIKGLTIAEFDPNGIEKTIRSIWHKIIRPPAPVQLLEAVAGG
jgi:MinD superfamily P-loop ATPase